MIHPHYTTASQDARKGIWQGVASVLAIYLAVGALLYLAITIWKLYR